MRCEDQRGVPRFPPLLRHASGRAYVRVRKEGRPHQIYFGRFGSAEARQRYAELIAALAAGQDYAPGGRDGADADVPTINELVVLYKARETVTRSKNVRSKTDLALRPLQEVHGDRPASEFGPRALAELRDFMSKDGKLNRRELNRRVQGIRRFFRWCVARELVPASTAHALAALEPLRAGEVCALREPKVVCPVSWKVVEETICFLSTPLRAAVLAMWWSGARAAELLQMRQCDVDRSVNPWRFEPLCHKTQRFGRVRAVFLGPNAQVALGPLLLRCASPTEFVFKPSDAIDERKRTRREKRRSQPSRWQQERDLRRASNPTLEVGERYHTTELNRAIARAVFAANATRKVAQMREWLHQQLPDRAEAITEACDRLALRMPSQALDRLARRVSAGDKSCFDTVRAAVDKIRLAQGQVEAWSVHRLRHAAATRLEAESHDIEGAAAVLGHARPDTTRGYIQRTERRAAELVAKFG